MIYKYKGSLLRKPAVGGFCANLLINKKKFHLTFTEIYEILQTLIERAERDSKHYQVPKMFYRVPSKEKER